MSVRLVVVLLVSLFATPALAAADLAVNLSAPTGASVYEPGGWDVAVANIGNKTANNVVLTIDLPETMTSPTVWLMGTLGAYDGRCVRAGATLSCSLGALKRHKTTNVAFTLALPQSSSPLTITATATTSSSESGLANNTSARTAALLHPALAVVAGDAALNEHCTGTNLTSFFECELYPSSISAHDVEFLAGGALFLPVAPSYSGSWSQPAADRLVFAYFDETNTLVASFDGWAVDQDCFEGLTTFPGSTWVSPYSVCLQ